MTDSFARDLVDQHTSEAALDLLRMSLRVDVLHVQTIGELLRDDEVYLAAADQLTAGTDRDGWLRLASRLEGLPAFRAAVLAQGCDRLFRDAEAVVFFGELLLGGEPERA